MKSILRLALVFVAAFTLNTAYSQVTITEAIDFTSTDTEGNTWNLFDVLDAGQYVVLDFWYTT